MKLVIDTNVLVASLIRDSFVRKFLVGGRHIFYLPEQALEEIEEHIQEISRKANTDEKKVYVLLGVIVSDMELVPKSRLLAKMGEALEIMGEIDADDAPVAACALAVGADAIVTYDKDFKRQKKILVFTPDEVK